MLNSNLLRKLDMQDLSVFVHVYERGSVTDVSDALCVSQSTVSYCLKKLRAGLEDELFVPVRGGMKPTEKACRIYPQILQIINSINQCHSGETVYEPTGEVQKFTVQAPEYFELVILPKLVALFHEKRLSVMVNVLKFGDEVPVDEMREGKVDLTICFGPHYHRRHFGLKSLTLLHDDLVCVTDSACAPEQLSFELDEFLQRRHVYPNPWTSATNMIDGWLAKRGVARNVVARANTYGAALGLLRGTDYVLTLPRRVVPLLCQEDLFACSAPPSGLPSFTLDMTWNEAADRSDSNTWFRQQIAAVASTVFEPGHREAASGATATRKSAS